MPIITLTTDFGVKDHFVGAVKGAIYSHISDAVIVDISHDISPFNVVETAYIVRNSYQNFPEGTIHIIGVDSEFNENNKHILLLLKGHYFICSDNGFISMIANETKPTKIFEINIEDRLNTVFPVRDVFVKIATHISCDGNLDLIGHPINTFKKLTEMQAHISTKRDKIIGNVIYIDNYGNAVSNITKKIFEEIGKGRPFVLKARNHSFDRINNKYSDIEERQSEGDKLLIFNYAELLEIAIYKSNLKSVGGASSLLGLNYRERIDIEFK